MQKKPIRMLLLALGLALLSAAPRAAEAAPAPALKRYFFSADSLAALRAQFEERHIALTAPLQAPPPGRGLRRDGTGPSGIPSHFLIEQVGGRFHVYAERRRPQQPSGPRPYVEQELVFDTPNPEVAPVGTLSYPRQGGPFPAVLLIAGTGAHTRDENISLHKPLEVLADHLTRQGFAVLRYDKRGVGLSGGAAHPASTTDDYAADALAAVRFLRMQTNVDARRIGLLGHSEGGLIAAMVAAAAPEEIQFIVQLGGPGLKGVDLKSLQDAAARRADGMPEALVLANQKQERELYEIAASPRERAAALAAMDAATKALPAELKAQVDVPEEGFPPEAFDGLLTPWMRRFLAIDPGESLEKVRCPVLALVGEKDLQVPAAENLAAIEQALRRGGNQRHTLRQLPGLNHLLQTARTGREMEYGLIEETMAPSALRLVSDWMRKTVR